MASKRPGIKTSVTGKGVFPHQAAKSLLNPLRALILSPRKLLGRLALTEHMTVLEVGPGPGYFSRAVAKAVPKGKLLLVDIQQEMLDMVSARLEEVGLDNFETYCGNARSLPFEDASVDVAFLVTVLGEVDEGQSCLEEIYRVLRPGGLLSVTEMRGDPDYLDRKQVERMARQAGFDIERLHRGLVHYSGNYRKPFPKCRT